MKTSLAPGSKVVTEYYERAGLTTYLDALGFNTVGYGCTTCIGNSGPLPEEISKAVVDERPRRLLRPLGQPELRGADPPRGEGELPRLAAARRRVRARGAHGRRPRDRAARTGSRRQRRLPLRPLADARRRSRDTVAAAIRRDMFESAYADVFDGDDRWRALPIPEGELFDWDDASTYVRLPAVLRRDVPRAGRRSRTSRARACLVAVGDSVTTDHISPAGSIKPDSPAGTYLTEHGIERKDFNSYGSRRGNHEVMVRGTFANVRLRNQLVPGLGGNVDGAPPRRRGDDDLRGLRALPRRGRAARSCSRARSTARARRATGPRRGRTCSACAR